MTIKLLNNAYSCWPILIRLVILSMKLNVIRIQISKATRIPINIIEKIRIVSVESFSRHEPKISKIGCVLTCKIPKNVYLLIKNAF